MQNNIETTTDKPIFKTTLFTEDALYEMVYNQITNKTSYFKYDKHGDLESFIDEVEINGKKYKINFVSIYQIINFFEYVLQRSLAIGFAERMVAESAGKGAGS